MLCLNSRRWQEFIDENIVPSPENMAMQQKKTFIYQEILLFLAQ
jgi:hypothetical protein